MLFGFPKWQVFLAAGLAILCGLGVAASAYQRHVVAEVTQQLTVARADAQAAITIAKHDSIAARAAEARADSALAVADSARRRATVLVAQNTRALQNYTKTVVPDTCKKLKAAADSALASDSAVLAAVRLSADSARTAAEQYRGALTTALSSLGSLSASTTRLDSAAAKVPKALNESFLSRITPHVGFGGAAGVNPSGHFDTVAGLTLGWRF